MDETNTAEALAALLRRWEKPPTDMVGKLPRKGPSGTIHLDYVGHAAVTRILIEADPFWSWEPVAWDEDGTPLIRREGKRLVLWGRLTVLGKAILCCGTCDASKWEPEKELIGDLLRNGAMRLGIGLSLWAKEEWSDLDVSSTAEVPEPSPPRRETRATRKPPADAPPPERPPESATEAERPGVPPVTTGAQRARALKLARELAERSGVEPPRDFDALTSSDLWPTVASDLGLAS